MKSLLFIVLSILSFSTFAQESYLSYEIITCSNGENCLVNPKQDFVIKGIDLENRNGEVVGMRLSSSSNIADTAYVGANLCFKGDPVAVCGLLNLMSYDDGHAMISNFSCFILDQKISLGYDVAYDMGPANKDLVRLTIDKCN